MGWAGGGCILVRLFHIMISVAMLIEQLHTRYSSPEVQLQRLMKRDNSSREDASSRLNSQLPIEVKVEYADQVIDNSNTLQDLQNHVDSFFSEAEKEAGWVWILSWLFPPFGLMSALWTLIWRRAQRSTRRKKS